MKNYKYAILFGAGAESCYSLPLGNKYTELTILKYRSKLFEALEIYYKNKIKANNEYCDKYYKEKLYDRNSIIFKEIIYLTIKYIRDNKDRLKAENKYFTDNFEKGIKSIYYCKNNQIKLFKNLSGAKYEKFINNVYNSLVTDEDIIENKKNKKNYNVIKDNIQFYGSIEKDFNTIINPNTLGVKKFWRIINYYWNAFFAIILPILNNSKKYSRILKKEQNKYSFILNNLEEILNYIYSDDYLKECRNSDGNDYYSQLNGTNIKPYCVLTTNYTPYINIMNNSKTYFLAGTLDQFELPNELSVISIINNEIDLSNKFLFPFLMTQSPIKPLVSTRQYYEYGKTCDSLDKCKDLYIVGYNLNENDNHINSIIRDFIVKKTIRKVYFFSYEKNIVDEEKINKNVHKHLMSVLKLDEKYNKRIEIIFFSGDSRDIIKLIEHNSNI